MSNKISWTKLLRDIVHEQGELSSCYKVFHRYSVGNQLLAWSQLQSRGLPVSPIATFKKWQEIGRHVKKGEKALALVMPVTIKTGDEDSEVMRTMFLLKNNWFALSQTDGADYQHEVTNTAWNADKALEALEVTLEPFTLLDGNCQGYAMRRSIAINPLAMFPHKTRFHEIAHVMLGHTGEGTLADGANTPRNLREVEAEAVAYICCTMLDLPGLAESRGYVQSWLGEGKDIPEKSAQKIFTVADKILKAGE